MSSETFGHIKKNQLCMYKGYRRYTRVKHFIALQSNNQNCESCTVSLLASVLLILQMENRSTACRSSGTIWKQMPRSGSFILEIRSKSQRLKSGEYDGWYSSCQPDEHTHQPQFAPQLYVHDHCHRALWVVSAESFNISWQVCDVRVV